MKFTSSLLLSAQQLKDRYIFQHFYSLSFIFSNELLIFKFTLFKVTNILYFFQKYHLVLLQTQFAPTDAKLHMTYKP